MTKIPDDHTAARELYDAFVALGQAQSEQQAPATPPRRALWRSRRLLVLAPIAVLALATAAGAARVILDDGPAIHGDRGAPPEISRAPHDTALATDRAADPAGGLPWGERLYSSANGGRCAFVGHVKDGALGVLRDGRFSALAPDAPGVCGRPGAHMLVATQTLFESSRRSVLFGFVDRSVRDMYVDAGGRRIDIPIATDGSYLLVSKNRIRGTLAIVTSARTIRRDITS
jgi:hypothetical protein